MEKSSIEVPNVRSCRNRNRQEHFKAITLSQGHEVRNYLAGRNSLSNHYNFYSARTVVDNFIKSEVDTGI
jgi:hypothetical protein